jgi:hypothetical protein
MCFFLPVIIVIRSAWNKILLDKLLFYMLVSKFSAVYGTRIKRTLFTGTRHWCLSSSRDKIGDGWLEVRGNMDGLVCFTILSSSKTSTLQAFFIFPCVLHVQSKCTQCGASIQFLLPPVSFGDLDEWFSVVGMAIRWGLDSPRIESRWG